jgi:peroxiredoxin Q/BCP
MMNRLLKISALSLLLLITYSGQLMANDLKVGDVAPDFQLVNQHAENISLSQFQGQWVVLYFYPKDGTPGCTEEACSFRDNINRLMSQEAVILGVSVDSAESHKDFAKKHDLPFSLLADENADVAKLYDSVLDLIITKFAKRHSFIIDPQGKIAKIYRDVDPTTHVRDVMADLKSLQEK